jgi:hypothetical protein
VRSSTTTRYRILWSAAVLATAGVFVVPALLISSRGYSGGTALAAAAESAFLRADLNGRVADSTSLATLNAQWREFHLVKALLAGVLVVALGALAVAVRQRSLALQSGVVLWLFGALTVLFANVQGAVAPLASLASLLPTGHGHEQLAGVLGRLREDVEADAPGSAPGIAGELLHDFTVYHAVLALLSAAATVVLVTVSVPGPAGEAETVDPAGRPVRRRRRLLPGAGTGQHQHLDRPGPRAGGHAQRHLRRAAQRVGPHRVAGSTPSRVTSR